MSRLGNNGAGVSNDMQLTAYAINGRETGVTPVVIILDASEPLCESLRQQGLVNKTRHRRRATVVTSSHDTVTTRSLAGEIEASVDDRVQLQSK